MTINATKGGDINIDARYVRLIPYNTGSGTITAGATITCGSATGVVIGLYSAFTSAPVLTGVATGWIKVTAWNSVSFPTSGNYTQAGFTFTITGADLAGFIELVGDEAATVTANRLGTFRVRGAWYEVGNTSGSSSTTYQLPTNGSVQYYPAVYVDSASSTVTAASWASNVATYTASGHTFVVGDELTVTGASPSGYNVTNAVITAVTATTFSVALGSNPGTWTSGGSAVVMEAYPCAGSLVAASSIATDAVRGKVCWASTGGVLRFGSDGTNTVGYVPPSGRRIRIPNILTANCTTAARGTNALPNATLASRYDFTTTGGGVIDTDKALLNWYPSFAQPFSVTMKYTAMATQLSVSEIAQPMVLTRCAVGQEAANAQFGLLMSLCFAGGTFNGCTWSSATLAASGRYVNSLTDVSGFTFNRDNSFSFVARGNATSGNSTQTRVANCTWNYAVIGTGRILMATNTNITYNSTTYYDNPATTTPTANPMNLFDMSSNCLNVTADGVDFGGLTLVQPYTGILNIGAAGCSNIKLRNLGTAASPLDMGGAYVDATWTRATVTMTITKTGHGLKVNDLIAVNIVSDTAPKAVTTTTATLWTVGGITDANNFTVTVSNAGATSGTLSYYPCMAGQLVTLASGAAASLVKIQRCYTPHLRTGLFSGDNSSKGVTFESVWGTEWGVQLVPELNCTTRGIQSTPALTAQTAVYGTHWFDFYTTGTPANLASQSWSRSSTTATLTSNSHGLRTGDQIVVNVSSDTAAIVLGVKTITATTSNAFTFTCLNAGGTSGTLTYTPLNGRVAIQMNEATSDTSTQAVVSNGAAFTSAGSLYMPSVNHQADFTTAVNLVGHSSFPIMEAVMAGGTISNYDITYSLDGGSTYKNLYYPRAGGGGSSSSTNVTMTSTTGVAVDDYVFGTNIAPNAKVSSITNSTTIVVNIANIGTVSGTLRFNHLPSETISSPSTGTPLKVRIKTSTANTTAITSLYFFATSTSAARTATYPLDTVTVKVTAKDAQTSATLSNARLYLTADTGGPLSPGTVIMNTLTDGSGVAQTTTFEYTGTNQPVTGRIRRGTSSPLYKTGPVSGVITSTGLDVTAFLVKDE